MPDINGHAVVFRQKLPAVIWWNILPKLEGLGNLEGAAVFEALDWPTIVAMVAGTVESWELDGDPQKADDVGALDVFEELIPLITEIAAYIGERGNRGNAESSESDAT